MSNRVNKVLGWGLTDLIVNQGLVVDPRVNPDGVLVADDDLRWTTEGFLDYFDNNPDGNTDAPWVRRAYTTNTGPEWDTPSRCFTREPDPEPVSDTGTVLCIRPLSRPSWHRRDDTIDWVQETYGREPFNENGETWATVLPDNPYPYLGRLMHAQTGEPLPSLALHLRFVILNDKDPDAVTGDEMAVACGFESFADAVTNLVPSVPAEIRALCEYTNAFKDPATVLSLRPMLFTYWA